MIPQNQELQVTLFGEVLADEFPDRAIIGGAPFNVARHLQALGITAHLISRLGHDELGEQIKLHLQQTGLTLSGLQQDDIHSTGRVQVTLESGGHRFEILPEQAYDYIAATQATAYTQMHPSSIFYFGTLAQRNATSRETLYKLLDSHEANRFLDLNLRAPWFEAHIISASLQHADILKVNEEELRILATILELPGEGPSQQVKSLIQRFYLREVIVTLGPEGAAWYDAEDNTVLAPSTLINLVKIVDTVGAGDAFSAVWLLGILLQWTPQETLARANQFASAICTIRGATPESLSFYQPFIAAWDINAA